MVKVVVFVIKLEKYFFRSRSQCQIFIFYITLQLNLFRNFEKKRFNANIVIIYRLINTFLQFTLLVLKINQ